MKTFKTKAGTELPLMNLQGKDYLAVANRVLWFREEHPDWSIQTEYLHIDGTYAVAKATISAQSGQIMATSHKVETQADFPAGHAEKAETGAIGRALALCGYGTQFAPELEEGERIVDSPIQRTKIAPPVSQRSVGAVVQAPLPPTGVVSAQKLIPFGKHKGYPYGVMRLDEVLNDLAYWEARLTKEGKPANDTLRAHLDELMRIAEPPAGETLPLHVTDSVPTGDQPVWSEPELTDADVPF